MGEILLAALIVGLIGLLIGTALIFAQKRFAVETDERITKVRECLPGNNCGACGYPGCDGTAEAIVKGETGAAACPVNSAQNNAKIAQIMGVEAEVTVKKKAFVKCAGDCDSTKNKCHYVGISDCRAAVLAGLPVWECEYGCLGFGSCAAVCSYDAIGVHHGVAVVDAKKCVGCGACAKACPQGLIELIPEGKKAAVACSNPEKGAEVKKVCSAGCIGCKLCTKQCEAEAISVDGFLARVDYEKCVGCGSCAEKCPSKVIRMV